MSADTGSHSTLFYKANIHEQRPAAILCRAAPMLSVLTVLGLCLYGTFKEQLLLLWTTAIFNMSLWIWVVWTALQSIFASLFMLTGLEQGPSPKSTPAACGGALTDSDSAACPGGSGGTGECAMRSVTHLIVLPNYKEDESMLAETLRSLAEAEDSKSFWIALAMETREGEEGKLKAERLKMRFESEFAHILITEHPDNLMEIHQDGSQNPEVPGKASNMKYALAQVTEECSELGVQADRVLLTVADADCIFHPLYFSRVGHEFCHLRDENKHSWTMWCAPQFPYRNFYTSPIVSRVWGYVQSTYEFGGLSGTAWGAHHMVFSSYTLPLSLAHNAGAWDGDGVAEDHHSSLKCFYYWLYTATYQDPQKSKVCWDSEIPSLRLRPVFLPVKSTMVANEEYWKSWSDRWQQAKRHAQGVSELSYALLATYDAFRTCLLPRRIFSLKLFGRMAVQVVRVWCMHVLPICQSICLATLTIKWVLNNRHIRMCPDRLWFFGDLYHWENTEPLIVCGFAGAWVLTWPVVIPWFLMVLSNTLLMYKSFLRPAVLNRYASIWHSQDAKVPAESHGLCYLTFRTLLIIMFDCIFGMSWILVPYGFLVELIAYFNVLFYGNCQFAYVTASKGICQKRAKQLPGNYGTIDKASAYITDEPPQKQQILIS